MSKQDVTFWGLVCSLITLLAFTGIMKGCQAERASQDAYNQRYSMCLVMGGGPADCKLSATVGK